MADTTYQPKPHQRSRYGTDLSYETALSLYAAGDREGLGYFLQSIDRNGCFTDSAMMAEYGEVATLEQLWENVVEMDLPCAHAVDGPCRACRKGA